MRMIVKPNQITSTHGKAYLNMLDTNWGGIGVWTGLYEQPIYLLKDGDRISFVTFASQEWADDWFEDEGDKYVILWKFEPD